MKPKRQWQSTKNKSFLGAPGCHFSHLSSNFLPFL